MLDIPKFESLRNDFRLWGLTLCFTNEDVDFILSNLQHLQSKYPLGNVSNFLKKFTTTRSQFRSIHPSPNSSNSVTQRPMPSIIVPGSGSNEMNDYAMMDFYDLPKLEVSENLCTYPKSFFHFRKYQTEKI